MAAASFVPTESLRRSARFKASELTQARRKLLTVQAVLLARLQCRDILNAEIIQLETKQTMLRRQLAEAERTKV